MEVELYENLGLQKDLYPSLIKHFYQKIYDKYFRENQYIFYYYINPSRDNMDFCHFFRYDLSLTENKYTIEIKFWDNTIEYINLFWHRDKNYTYWKLYHYLHDLLYYTKEEWEKHIDYELTEGKYKHFNETAKADKTFLDLNDWSNYLELKTEEGIKSLFKSFEEIVIICKREYAKKGNKEFQKFIDEI